MESMNSFQNFTRSEIDYLKSKISTMEHQVEGVHAAPMQQPSYGGQDFRASAMPYSKMPSSFGGAGYQQPTSYPYPNLPDPGQYHSGSISTRNTMMANRPAPFFGNSPRESVLPSSAGAADW